MRVGFRPFHRQQYRAAPFAPDPNTLDEAQHDHDDGAPDADLLGIPTASSGVCRSRNSATSARLFSAILAICCDSSAASGRARPASLLPGFAIFSARRAALARVAHRRFLQDGARHEFG